jgi:hypothetical protein
MALPRRTNSHFKPLGEAPSQGPQRGLNGRDGGKVAASPRPLDRVAVPLS